MNDNQPQSELNKEFTPEIEIKTETPEDAPAQPAQDPMAQAATMFGMCYPRFIGRIDTLSNKSLKRVIRALIGVPLEEVMPNFKRPEEKEAYLLGEKLLEAKAVIIIHSMYEHQKELDKAMAEAAAKKAAETNSDTTVKEDNKENVNG
jgi:hypothetical protein